MTHFQYCSRPHNSQGQACTHPSSTLLNHIYQTISRQILCLVTFVALHNYHQQIQNTTQNLLKVTMGGIPFTSDIQRIGFKDFIKLKMSIGLNFFNNDYQNWVQIHQIRRKSKSQKFSTTQVSRTNSSLAESHVHSSASITASTKNCHERPKSIRPARAIEHNQFFYFAN